MADEATPPTEDELATMRAIWARQSLVLAANRSTADQAMAALVSSPQFTAGYEAMKLAQLAKPGEVDLTYAVVSMRKLVSRYGGIPTD